MMHLKNTCVLIIQYRHKFVEKRNDFCFQLMRLYQLLDGPSANNFEKKSIDVRSNKNRHSIKC